MRAHAIASDEPEHLVGEVLGEGAERGPLAADEAEQRRARALRDLGPLDAVVARDEAGLRVVVARQRPHAREAVDDLRAVDVDRWENVRDEVEEVVDLLLGAHRGLPHVVLEVGRADHHAALERVDEHDAAVLVLEEDLPSGCRREQLGVVEHDVRALGAAHERRRAAEVGVREVGPGAGGVDHDVGGDGELLAGEAVAHPHAVGAEADRREVVRRAGVRAGGESVEEHVEGEALGIVHARVVVGGGVLDVGVQRRQLRERALAAVEPVAGHRCRRRARTSRRW